jgi:hypothetical protein
VISGVHERASDGAAVGDVGFSELLIAPDAEPLHQGSPSLLAQGEAPRRRELDPFAFEVEERVVEADADECARLVGAECLGVRLFSSQSYAAAEVG